MMRTPVFQDTFTIQLRTHTPIGHDSGNRVIYRDDEFPMDNWVKWPGWSHETDTPVEDTVSDKLYLLNTNSPDIEYLSEVQLPGDDTWYEVEGKPWKWQSPLTGTVLGTQITLKGVL